jgi:anti-sigma factor RsiW
VTGLELTCQQIIDYLMAYLDGELPERERAIFDKHLFLCKECVDYLESYKTTVALAKESAVFETNAKPTEMPNVPEGLIKAILASRDKAS